MKYKNILFFLSSLNNTSNTHNLHIYIYTVQNTSIINSLIASPDSQQQYRDYWFGDLALKT